VARGREFPRYAWEQTVVRTLPRGRVYRPDADAPKRIAAWAARHPPVPTVTVCIPSQDRLDLLAPSLAATCGQQDVDVLIADTGSGGGTLSIAASGWRSSRSRGASTSPARNLAAARANGELLLFLNSDTVALSRDWVQRLRSSAAAAPAAGAIIGAGLLYPGTRRVQEAGVTAVRRGRWPQLRAYAPRPRDRVGRDLALQSVGLGRRLEELGVRARVMAVSGAFLAIDRTRFQALGGFDEAFATDLQDIDLCLRARVDGVEVISRRDIVFSHRHAASRGRYAFPLDDWRLLVERWGEELRLEQGSHGSLTLRVSAGRRRSRTRAILITRAGDSDHDGESEIGARNARRQAAPPAPGRRAPPPPASPRPSARCSARSTLRSRSARSAATAPKPRTAPPPRADRLSLPWHVRISPWQPLLACALG
jgi:GT2 family glycosyltransferase